MSELNKDFELLTQAIAHYCDYRLDTNRVSLEKRQEIKEKNDNYILLDQVTQTIKSILPKLSEKISSELPSFIFIEKIVSLGITGHNDQFLILIWEKYYMTQALITDIARLSNYSTRSVHRHINLFPERAATALWTKNNELSNPEIISFSPQTKRQQVIGILKREFWLTDREVDVILAYNWSVPHLGRKIVANKLDISINTLKTHHNSICKKMHVGTMNNAISKAQIVLRENGIEKYAEGASINRETFAQDSSERQNIIEAIKTPLGFFSLVVLVVEALIEVLLVTNIVLDKGILQYAVIGIPVLSILLVWSTALLKPEALWGKRYSGTDESIAKGLGEDIYTALDGYLKNLQKNGRMTAYKLLRQTITSSPHIQSRNAKRFREILAETIIRRAELQDKWRKTKHKARARASNKQNHENIRQIDKKEMDL